MFGCVGFCLWMCGWLTCGHADLFSLCFYLLTSSVVCTCVAVWFSPHGSTAVWFVQDVHVAPRV